MANTKTGASNKTSANVESKAKSEASVQKAKGGDSVTIKCAKRANQSIAAIDGAIVTFDSSGKAQVTSKIAKYLISCSCNYVIDN